VRITLSPAALMVLTAGMKRNTIHIFTAVAGLALTATMATGADQDRKAGIGPSFKGPIGLQLYSLRDQFAKDVPGTLDRVRDLGFRYVELAGTYGLPPEQFKQMLAERGLVPVGSHFSYDKYRDDPEGVARDAAVFGLKQAGCAWIPHDGDFDEKECREAIAVFNRAGEALARHGIEFYYHAHGYEFQPYGSGTLFDLMMAETKPRYVHYQMDVFWILYPGQDPTSLMKKYGKRWTLMHMKDLKKGVKLGDLSGHTDVANNVVMGTGQVDWTSLLRASRKAGLKYYFIEDESPSVVEQIPQSLRYLEQVKF